MLKNPPRETGDETLGIPSNTLSSCSFDVAGYRLGINPLRQRLEPIEESITSMGTQPCAGENPPYAE